ncbi:adenosylcobinamide-GDP ribazoletransferase, partial [Ameyamaea chiangmaiensis]
PLGRTVWAWPLVGALVGACGGSVAYALRAATLPPLVAAFWALVAQSLLTGALHEDGLADTADGLFGGRTPARRLEIMRDSRIGGYGAVALCLGFGIRAAALAALPAPALLPALLFSGALSRSAMAVPLLCLAPARADGLASTLRRPAWTGLAVVTAVILLPNALILPARPAVVALASVLVVSLWLSGTCRRRLGGYTGDTLGATVVLSECVALSALSAAAG